MVFSFVCLFSYFSCNTPLSQGHAAAHFCGVYIFAYISVAGLQPANGGTTPIDTLSTDEPLLRDCVANATSTPGFTSKPQRKRWIEYFPNFCDIFSGQNIKCKSVIFKSKASERNIGNHTTFVYCIFVKGIEHFCLLWTNL